MCRHCGEGTGPLGGEATLTRGNLAAHKFSCPSAPDVPCATAAEGCAWAGRAAGLAVHVAGCALAPARARFQAKEQRLAAFAVTLLACHAGQNEALLQRVGWCKLASYKETCKVYGGTRHSFCQAGRVGTDCLPPVDE
jgi:hypothetical protein